MDPLKEIEAKLSATDYLLVLPTLLLMVENIRRKDAVLTAVQTSLEDIRLGLKSVQFDLEATRRERNEYKQKLEAHGL
jgi:uncharacterized protein (DUF3084 family)